MIGALKGLFSRFDAEESERLAGETKALFAPLAAALDKLEAWEQHASENPAAELAGILDDICRAWKTLKERE